MDITAAQFRGIAIVPAAFYITTETFERGGNAIAGPYLTRDDAMNARVEIERVSGNTTYWIDRGPKTMVRVKS